MTAKTQEKRRTVLRDLIDERGLRYVFVANRLGLSGSGFSLLCDGLRSLRARHLVALEDVLGVKAAAFFDGERLLYADEIPPPDGVGAERTQVGVALQGSE